MEYTEKEKSGRFHVFDTETSDEKISHAFARAAGGRFANLEKHRLSIPHNREAEISFLLGQPDRQRLELAFAIYNRLAGSPDIQIVPGSAQKGTERLLSLNIDTVLDGRALREVEKAGYTRRMRFPIDPQTGAADSAKIDHSIKTLQKNAQRSEYECHGKSLQCRGEHFYEENPQLPPIFATLDNRTYCVPSICLAARGTYKMVHFMPDLDTAILYDNCIDACTMADPHGIPTDFRAEKEIEGKYLYTRAVGETDYQGQHDLIDESLRRLHCRIVDVAPNEITLATEAKVSHSLRRAAEYHQKLYNFATLDETKDHLLLQGMEPHHYDQPAMRHNLSVISGSMVAADLLLPHNARPNYDEYFNRRHLGLPAGTSVPKRRPALVG